MGGSRKGLRLKGLGLWSTFRPDFGVYYQYDRFLIKFAMASQYDRKSAWLTYNLCDRYTIDCVCRRPNRVYNGKYQVHNLKRWKDHLMRPSLLLPVIFPIFLISNLDPYNQRSLERSNSLNFSTLTKLDRLINKLLQMQVIFIQLFREMSELHEMIMRFQELFQGWEGGGLLWLG